MTSIKTDSMAGLLEEIEGVYCDLRKHELKQGFFENCSKANILPDGLKLSFNLALGVNDASLVCEIKEVLEQASTNILHIEEILYYLFDPILLLRMIQEHVTC